MSVVVILTSTYPFPPGEQFLESEIEHWGASPHAVIILPLTAVGSPRRLPSNISLDLSVAQRRTIWRKIYFYLVAPFTYMFAREVRILVANSKVRPSVIHSILLSISRTLNVSQSLRHFTRKHGYIDTAYCYWNDVQSYAAVLAKRRGDIGTVVARCHGVDLYEELRPGGYMPLKRQFIKGIDLIAPVSSMGRDYFIDKYRPDPRRVIVNRLGVRVPTMTSRCSPPGHLCLISVSFCSAGKQIERIIDAIALLAIATPETAIAWTHIGDGPLLNDLRERARTALDPLPKVAYRFEGRLDNADVLNYYSQWPVDIFVNASRSEGVPVSIMEAMGYGIPAVGPNVGGVRELITDGAGFLLSQNPTSSEIASALLQYAREAKAPATRSAVRRVVANNFAAQSNYPDFIRSVSSLSVTTQGPPYSPRMRTARSPYGE